MIEGVKGVASVSGNEEPENQYEGAIESSGIDTSWISSIWGNDKEDSIWSFFNKNKEYQIPDAIDEAKTGADVTEAIHEDGGEFYNLSDFFTGGSIGDYMKKIFKAEARGNVRAHNPFASAAGPYQFIASTWKGYCKKYGLNYSLEDRYDMAKASHVMRLMTEENARALKKTLGRDPSHGELYLAHFLGIGGAQKALSHSKNDSVLSIMSPHTADINWIYTKVGGKKTGAYNTIGAMMMALGKRMA